ncbi:MAG: hypothetical protein O7B35_16100 [Deltaproteobacteria bacterium]|nr:hypothetical protein [Deltaproteobacteria bacterium]
MDKRSRIPWASGPGEILGHGLDLLKKDSDANRRLAMICIDNSVELMIKTYLGLPKRITGLTISRRQYQEIADSFPNLLEGLELHAADKLEGVDLGAIEWYHRLRNQLYHEGNGLTVGRDKIEIYAELANKLFENLFGYKLVERITMKTELLSEFMIAWVSLESSLRSIAGRNALLGTTPKGMLDVMTFLRRGGIIEASEVNEINELRRIRNDVVHGFAEHESILTPKLIERVKEFARSFSEMAGPES